MKVDSVKSFTKIGSMVESMGKILCTMIREIYFSLQKKLLCLISKEKRSIFKFSIKQSWSIAFAN